jgi:uncharacterized repeat protein (TIGR03803 family)
MLLFSSRLTPKIPTTTSLIVNIKNHMVFKNLYVESVTHLTMNSQSLWFKAAILLFFAIISLQSNVLAQNPNLLYGVTSRGGIDGAGVIFHIDKTTATQTVDYSFLAEPDGSYPEGDLTDGGNGKFYGMTGGGPNGMGIIFEWDPITNNFIKKVDFDGTEKGSLPSGNLTLYNGKFYGMTQAGGVNSKGVVFEWDPVSNVFVKKIDFDGINNGRNPKSSLCLNNGKFYGVTYMGGVNDKGVIFEWDPLTNIFSKKFDFDSTDSGILPEGSLIVYSGKLFGMASRGGATNNGTIYEWDLTTHSFNKRIDFDGINGSWPKGALANYGSKLYGMTRWSGPSSYGIIFEWDPVTNFFAKKIDLNEAIGSFPQGSLTYYNGQFYGTTTSGGLHQKGVIFKWDPLTNIYSKQIDFNPTPDGNSPYGSLTFMGGLFYGMTYNGGLNDKGVIFSWNPATNLIVKAVDFFNSPSGSNSYGSLTLSSGKFYGMTHDGGTVGDGVIFEWNPATNMYTKKIDFSGSAGSHPHGTLVFFNGKYYGVTSQGGAYNKGVIFEWDPLTNIFIKKVDFDGTAKGNFPISSMTLYNGKFYGMTWEGGANYYGVIYEWNPTSNVFVKKIDFAGTNNGSSPEGDLTLLGSKFYGMTESGGINDMGIIFEWDPLTNIFTKKFDFDGLGNGAVPFGSLSLYNGKLYGMTYFGGLHGKGVIFEMDPFANSLIKRIDFDGTDKGRRPMGSLLLNGGKFYGMTYQGGTNNWGVIFEWDPGSINTFTKLLDFNSINGRVPAYTRLVTFIDSTTAAQATNIYFTAIQNTQMNINWVDGRGDKRAVFIKQSSDGTAAPVNNNTYVANTTFGSGTQIGATGWYCVFNGTEHNAGVAVTNLLTNTAYRVMVCEYTGAPGFEQYNDSTAEGNPANQIIGTYFAVVTTSSPTTGGTTYGGGSYLSGAQATVSATPNTGYNFINWTENSNVVSTSAGYTFVVTANRNLVANFAPQQYIISTSSNPIAGGTTSGGGTYNFGATATVTATANTTWTFLNWTENGNVVSTTPVYSFTVGAGRTLVANFTQDPTFLITTASAPVSGGTSSGGGNYYSGQPATVTATANAGYNFANWSENGNVVSTTASYSFTVNGARSLVANFVLQQYNIITSANPTAGGTTSGDGTFTYGDQATVTATANSNFTFSYWLENGTVVATTPQYSFTVTASSLLVANFEPDPTYLITTYSMPAYGGTTSGGGNFLAGQTATVSATANTGYDFANWTENGNVVSTEVNYSFTVTGARALTANFVLLQYTVTTSPNPPAGGITNGDGTYNYGAQVTLNATANTNWTFLNWTENGSLVSTMPEYVFIVNTNQSFVANFTQSPTYQVTTSSSPVDGGISFGGGNYIAGQVATVSAISNTGYSFTNWTESGNVVSTDSVYSFTVTANTDLVANFDPADFLISATTIPAGSGTVNGGGIYSYGSTATLTATYGKSWVFYEWTENCNPVSGNESYSFVVTSSRDFAAVFYQPGIQYVTTTFAEPIEGGYVTGCGTYYIDSVATVHAVQYSGWEFVNWTENGMPVSSGSEYSYQVMDHRILTANFRLYTGIKETQSGLIRVFPNPTEDKLFIEWDSETTRKFDEVNLYNSLSQLVFQQNTKDVTGRLTIDVKSFAPGVYYLVVKLKGAKVDDFRVVVKK